MEGPITWISGLQYQISLINKELEYITLSQSMCELIYIREVIKEIQTFVITGKNRIQNIELTPNMINIQWCYNC